MYPARQGGLLPPPRGLAGSYVFVGHGDSGRTTVPRRGARADQAVHPRYLGRMPARRRSTQTLSPEAPVWLLICEMSMTQRVTVSGLLERVPPGHVLYVNPAGSAGTVPEAGLLRARIPGTRRRRLRARRRPSARPAAVNA